MIKFLLILIVVLVFFLLIFLFMYRHEKKKLRENELLYEELHDNYVSLENACFKLKEEKRIADEQKDKLIKKLADISVMSVDDVMRQLQNEG